MKDTSTLRRRSEVSARFHSVQKLLQSSPFYTKGARDPNDLVSRLVRVSPCAEEISCIVTCSRHAKSWGCQEFLGIPCVIATPRCDAAGAPLGTVQALLGHSSPRSRDRFICMRFQRSN